MARRFRLTLEEVVGPEGDEETEMLVYWDISGKGKWTLDAALLESVRVEVAKRTTRRK